LGETGVVHSDLSPEGKVFVHGEIWRAEASEAIPKGTKVVVVEVMDGLKIKVKKAH
jgi:membrane-bound serine protease (ClpP class)